MSRIPGVALRMRSISSALSSRRYLFSKPLSTTTPTGDSKENPNSYESTDEFEARIFGGGSNPGSESFFQKLDRLEKGRNRPGSRWNEENNFSVLDGLDESFDTLSDGMDGKLTEAATYFEFDPEEVFKDDYAFRPDMTFQPGSTYDIKDLDLTKPGVSKFPRREDFKVTTEEVLKKADFRNVRFLANFITEAGIIVKRSKTGISAKAHRKVAREIKTARAFGLMPFTTMGTKSFVFGKTMEQLDKDFQYETLVDDEADERDNPLDASDYANERDNPLEG